MSTGEKFMHYVIAIIWSFIAFVDGVNAARVYIVEDRKGLALFCCFGAAWAIVLAMGEIRTITEGCKNAKGGRR